jgi:hypothetical protein
VTRIVLDADDGRLRVTAPDEALTDGVLGTLTADTEALTLVAEIFPGVALVPSWPEPLPAERQALLDAARALSYPWLRLQPGAAVMGDADAWHAWLAGDVSPADLQLARRRLAAFAIARVAGTQLLTRWVPAPRPRHSWDGWEEVLCFVPRGTRDADNVPVARSWRDQLSATFTSSPAQVCTACGGHRWRRSETGDVCVICHPEATTPAVPTSANPRDDARLNEEETAMFILSMPTTFTVGATEPARINGTAMTVTYLDADTLVIGDTDARRILEVREEADGLRHFVCGDAARTPDAPPAFHIIGADEQGRIVQRVLRNRLPGEDA